MEISLNILQIILAVGITFIGAALQGSIGFGLGLIGVPLLVMLDPVFVPGPLLLTALFLTIMITVREHHSINLKEIKWAIAGRFIGSLIGAMLLLVIPRSNISLLFGSMVLLAVVISIAGMRLQLNPLNLLGAGTFSGILATTSAIGGAPMALVYQHQKGPRLRGSLSSIFIFGTIISLITLIIIHRFGSKELLVTLVLLPGTFFGFALSNHISKFLDRGFIRPAVLVASAISGCIVILKNIL